MTDNKTQLVDIKTQKETHDELKRLYERSQELTEMIVKKKFPNEATQLFYQLPLDDEQREKLYKELMDEYNKQNK